MRKKSEYFLIARNRETNEFQIISINGNRENRLEDIDLYTISFKDKNALEERLRQEDIIIGDNYDFFIVSQHRAQGESFLRFQEALFESSKSIKGIAENSKNNQIENSMNQIDYLLDTFAYQMSSNQNFRQQVLTGKTGVYEKYAKYFLMNGRRNQIKYKENGWARKSYQLIRNVVEAMTRKSSRYTRLSNQMYREMLRNELLRVTSSDYDPNQLYLPNFFQQPDVLDKEDKLLEVMSTFESLPSETFSIDIDIAGFNPKIFTEYKAGDLQKFQTYLPTEVRLALQLFLSQRDALETATDNRIVLYQNGVQKAQKNLIRLFSINPELLNRAYDWCKLYDSYQDKMIGGIHGKEYRKKKQD